MKRGLIIVGAAFAITLALILGFRVSADALAVIVGVALGIIASIPTTMLLIFVMTRQQNRLEKNMTHFPHQPPVVVVNAADKFQSQPSPPALPPPYAPNGARKWTVIGDLESDD